MGLDIHAAGLPRNKSYHAGYSSFHHFRNALANAVGEEFGRLHHKYCNDGLTEDELHRINELGTPGLLTFLSHSDCDGKLTPYECRVIYKEIKDMTLPGISGFDYETQTPYNALERWKEIMKHCATRRVNCWFY